MKDHRAQLCTEAEDLLAFKGPAGMDTEYHSSVHCGEVESAASHILKAFSQPGMCPCVSGGRGDSV